MSQGCWYKDHNLLSPSSCAMLMLIQGPDARLVLAKQCWQSPIAEPQVTVPASMETQINSWYIDGSTSSPWHLYVIYVASMCHCHEVGIIYVTFMCHWCDIPNSGSHGELNGRMQDQLWGDTLSITTRNKQCLNHGNKTYTHHNKSKPQHSSHQQ